MNRFVLIAPTYNAEKTAKQAIMSLASQTHDNWHLVVIDDLSTDGTENLIKNLFSTLGITDKLTYIKNSEKLWEVANVLQALKHCKDDDIACRFDLDDYMIDNQAFEIINTVYMDNPNLEALWTAHRWFDKNGITNVNISAEMPERANPYEHPWVSSHLKTFRKRVINDVSDENFRGADGSYIKRAGDQAIYLPVLAKARQRGYLPIQTYAYRCDMSPETFQTDDAKFQKSEADFLRKRGFVK